MQTSVELQDPFHYSIVFLLGLILIVLMEILLEIWLEFKNKKKNILDTMNEYQPRNDIEKIKRKYIEKLDIINYKVKQKKISVRGAYQGLSNIIRFFVFEATGIKVQNYTLSEIKTLKIEELSELIEEYYVPEFSEKTEETIDINESLTKTKEIIKRWN